MATTRTREGTLPSRTYEAVTRGVRTRDSDEMVSSIARARLRRTEKGNHEALNSRSSDNLLSQFDSAQPKVICRLKVPNFADELGRILGDADREYYGLFEDDPDAVKTYNTTPTAEDRALCGHLGDAAAYHRTPAPESNPNETKLTIHFGESYTMDAWYHSAYPAEYTRRDYLTVCNYCLNYTVSDLTAERHRLKCSQRTPPGRQIYKDGDLSMWEVDGTNASLYCQNLCLLAKAFLSSKSLYRDVQPFYFYVLTKSDENGAQFVGYFSKQKMYSLFRPSEPIQSVSCIMALPFTQQKGYGQFLIEFSYLLARQQQATGSPETPLSELGERSFRSFWKRKICFTVDSYLTKNQPFTVSQLSKDTGIHINHVVLALEDLGWLSNVGSQSSNPTLKVSKKQIDNIIKKWEARNPVQIRAELLMWVPLYE